MLSKDHADRFGKNILITIGTLLLFLITRMIIPPLVLHYVSLREYGLWSYAFILVSYLGMSVFGISNVYVRYSAVYFSKGEEEKIGRLVSTGMTAVACIAAVLLTLLWFILPAILHWLNVSDENYATAFWLAFGLASIFFFELIMGAFSAVLQGIQEMALERIISTASYVLETVLIFIFLMLGFGIYSLLIAYVLRTLVGVIAQIYACHSKLEHFHVGWAHVDRSMLPLFYHFGGIVQLSGMLSIFNRSLEKLFAGVTMGAKTTALYEIGEKFPLAIVNLPGAVNAVLLPTSSYLHDHPEALKELYIHAGRYLHMMAGFMLAFVWAWATPLMTFWLGNSDKYSEAIQILVFFSVAYQMDVLTGPASALYRSINEPIRELVYPTTQFVLCVTGFFWLQYLWGPGIPTINWGVAGGMVLSALAYILWSNRYFQLKQGEYFYKVFFPGVMPYLVATLLAYFIGQHTPTNRWEAFKILAVAGITYSAVVVPLLYFLLAPSERAYLWQKLGR